jgi:hypothetical protein
MKKIVLILLVSVFSISLAPKANADDIDASDMGGVPAEVSAVLTSPAYAKLIEERRVVAESSGRILKVRGFTINDFGPGHKYAYVFLVMRIAADAQGKWTPAGSIAGHIVYGPTGEITSDGIYFKPADDVPGGASVGNN